MAEPAEVGVAVPVYNGEPFLADALRSVLAQTHRVDDVLVLDDGSEDASAEIASGFGPPVRVERRSHDGIGAARSEAIGLVEGEFIVPLDADDLLTPNSIGCRIELMTSTDLDVVFGQVRRFTNFVNGGPVPLDEARPAHVPELDADPSDGI